MSVDNPYAPPSVQLTDNNDDHYDGNALLIPNGRRCPAGNGWSWVTDAWRLFKKAPVMFWVAMLIMLAIGIVISIIPVVKFANAIIMPLIVAGFGACAHSAMRDGSFELGQLFDGFRRRPGALLLCGLISLIIKAVIVIAILLPFGSMNLLPMLMGAKPNPAALLAKGSMLLLYIPLGTSLVLAAVIYAPYLIQEHDELSAPTAMLMSFKGCMKNIGAGLMFMVATIIFGILATIPIGLGWLVFIPVLYLAVYMSYRDIFLEPGSED